MACEDCLINSICSRPCEKYNTRNEFCNLKTVENHKIEDVKKAIIYTNRTSDKRYFVIGDYCIYIGTCHVSIKNLSTQKNLVIQPFKKRPS